MHGTTTTDNRGRILDFLGQVDRRLRLNDALAQLTKGLWGLAALLVLLKLAGLWDHPTARLTLLVVYGFGLAFFLGYRFVSGRALSRTAVIADHRGGLHDTLTSAHAFLGLPNRSRWMDFQIERAAESTDSLTAGGISPMSLPRHLLPALGVGVALFALFSWNPAWLREIDAPSLLARQRAAEKETMEDILDEAEPQPEEQAKLEELEDAIETLKQQDLELEGPLGDLATAQEALAASRVDMEQLQKSLEAIGANLEANDSLSELAQALTAHDAERAAELLRQLAERLSDPESAKELNDLLEALSKSNLQQGDLAEMMDDLESAGGKMSQESMAKMAQALLDAADQLQQMGQQMASQGASEGGEDEMSSMEASLAEAQSPGQQSGDGQQQQAGQASQSASGAISNQMMMGQMKGDPSSALPMDAGPAGEGTGPGGGESQVLGEATSLDVQLQMEVLEKKDREEPVPEETFERLSREEKSTLNYEVIRQRGSYADERTMTRERVPWQYRSLVKRYFMSIVANSETKAESSEKK